MLLRITNNYSMAEIGYDMVNSPLAATRTPSVKKEKERSNGVVKAFVTAENIDDFPSGEEELKMLMNDILWVEGEKKKVLCEGERWWMDGGYSRGVNQLWEIGFFNVIPHICQSKRAMTVVPGVSPMSRREDIKNAAFSEGYRRLPEHYFSEGQEQYPQIPKGLIDVGGVIIDGVKVEMNKEAIATWFVHRDSQSARSWGQPLCSQYILTETGDTPETQKAHIWCYALGDSGPGYSGSSPSRGFEGQIGKNTQKSCFPKVDSSFWNDATKEDCSWAGREYFTWKKVDNLAECQVSGCDVLENAWKRAYVRNKSYINIGDYVAEELLKVIKEDGSINEDDGEASMSGMDIEHYVTSEIEKNRESIKWVDSRLSRINDSMSESNSLKGTRIREVEKTLITATERIDGIIEWSASITEAHNKTAINLESKVEELERKLEVLEAKTLAYHENQRKMEKEIDKLKSQPTYIVPCLYATGVGLGVYGIFC